MNRNRSSIDNQKGSLCLIVLLIMATLAIAGLMVTQDAVTESQIGRNYIIYKQCMMAAEAAGKEFIQAIDSIFQDSLNGSEAIAALATVPGGWTPHDGYNTTFGFDENQWSTYNIKTSNVGNAGFLENAEAVAVLVHQTSSAMTPGLGGSKVPEFYTYTIFCRAVHARAGDSETILMIGYRQKKI